MHANNTTYSREVELAQIRAAQLDPSRFAPLYDRYYRVIFVFIYNKTRNKELTGDLTSTVFLKAILNLSKYKDRGYPFSSWLYRIAINEVNMFFRAAKKEIDVEISESEAMSLMEDMDEKYNEANGELVLEVLAEMPEDLNNLIELRFMQKLSFQEIGGILGLAEPAAKMKVYRAVEKLKEKFQQRLKERQ